MPIRETRQSAGGAGPGEHGSDMQSGQVEQAGESRTADEVADTQATQATTLALEEVKRKALESMEAAKKVIDNNINFVNSIETRVENLETRVKTLEEVQVEARLEALDELKLVDKVDELENLKAAHDRVKSELEDLKKRPKPFDYERTLVLSNVNYDPSETDADRRQMVGRIFTEGFLKPLESIPDIVATARLPHNAEKRDPNYHPGLKVEFQDNHTRNLVLFQSHNLRKHKDYCVIEARESMSVGDRRAVECFRHITWTLRSQGIQGLNHIFPNGRMREWRPQAPRQPQAATLEAHLPSSGVSFMQGGRLGGARRRRPVVNVSAVPHPTAPTATWGPRQPGHPRPPTPSQ